MPFLLYRGTITASMLLLTALSSHVLHSEGFKDKDEAEVVNPALLMDKFALQREITGKPNRR